MMTLHNMTDTCKAFASMHVPVIPPPRALLFPLAKVHYEHATFLIANIRSCELLPPPLREWPSVGMKPVLGRLMERSCARVCEELPGAHCSQRDFPWIHTCAALQSTAGTAGCPGGCALKQVTEVPTAPSVWQKECTLRAGRHTQLHRLYLPAVAFIPSLP
jgi:hypothetical protein